MSLHLGTVPISHPIGDSGDTFPGPCLYDNCFLIFLCS